LDYQKQTMQDNNYQYQSRHTLQDVYDEKYATIFCDWRHHFWTGYLLKKEYLWV